jgi:hypothetical protein
MSDATIASTSKLSLYARCADSFIQCKYSEMSWRALSRCTSPRTGTIVGMANHLTVRRERRGPACSMEGRRPRSLSDLFHACVAAQKAPLQGARSAMWAFHMSEEQRGRDAFWTATRRASLVLGALRRCKSLVVNDTTARFAPCTASQNEARAYAKQVRQAPRTSRDEARTRVRRGAVT